MRRYSNYLLLIALGYPLLLWSQWTIHTNQPILVESYFDIHHIEGGEFQEGFHFFGLPKQASDTIILKGLVPDALDDKALLNTINQSSGSWLDISPVKSFSIDPDSAFFYLNLYCQNVKTYAILVQANEGTKHFHKKFKVKEQGYQPAFEISFSSWEEMASEQTIKTSLPNNSILDDNKLLTAERVLISIEKVDPNQPFKFVLGEGQIYKRRLIKSPAKGPVFYELTGEVKNNTTDLSKSVIGNAYPYLMTSSFHNFSNTNFYCIPENKHIHKEALAEATLQLIAYLVNKYPYFELRDLDKELIVNQLQEIIERDISFENKLFQLEQLIKSMDDGHFFIKTPKKRLLPGPVFIKMIQGQVQVVAVLDPSLKDHVKEGMQVLAIDNMEVHTLIEQELAVYQKYSASRKAKIISSLLYRTAQEKTSISVTNGLDTFHTTLRYDQRYKIPRNFIPKHNTFSIWEGKYAYWRVNRWQDGDWVRFLNKQRQLEEVEGLIIDLRKNPGGVELEAFRVLSTFINNPITTTKKSYTWENGQVTNGSSIIFPSTIMDLSDKKVFILVDDQTACASEQFAGLMRSHADALILSSTPTAGSLAAGVNFHLPFDIVIRANTTSKFELPQAIASNNGVGIEPDIYVPITDYRDLFPYDDKLLKTALQLLAQY